METKRVLKLKKIAINSPDITKFEISFLRSITKDENIYNKSVHYNDLLNTSDIKKNIGLSIKQNEVFLNIEAKYIKESIEGDIFEKYSKIFVNKGIELDNFDKRHLETFKGVFIESENFKKWFNDIK